MLAIADGLIGHALPLTGDSQSVVGGIVLGLVFNLIAVAVLAVPLGMLLRVRRRDLPGPIARNYAGTFGVVVVTLAFTAIGLAHHPTIDSDRAMMHDAAARAAAWIGDHAPAQFRADAGDLTTVVIQGDAVYRECATNLSGTRDYCVIVDERRPVTSSVLPAGSESNQTLARGMN